MDIAQISMNLSQGSLMNAVGTTLLGKAIDMSQEQADFFTDSMNMNSPSLESLVYPTSGTAIDIRV